MQTWNLNPNCKSIVKKIWNYTIHGDPMFVLNHKLKDIKQELDTWNTQTFGTIHNRVIEATLKINNIQLSNDNNGPSDTLLEQEKAAKIEPDYSLQIEDVFWREKARAKWNCEGDKNTAYFHRLTKIKQATKKISMLNIENNHIIEDTIPCLISDQINDVLSMIPTPEEIVYAVFAMNKNGALGSDGNGESFFQSHWNTVKFDVIAATSQFFSQNWISPN
ncbi:unnamed protein product [Lathyrus oleraceus]|uniref:Uncharacterized protein n=1 Tax=Pisum sativum TaxID=3888 RepID=A0A9D5ADP6_PEA|nr:uncharacterized protein LOC127085441 [Pisum sativum]KAI5404076.1 hypothetical protein KIW84_051279 [Pisum sativum]